ncbi:MAG: CpaD family pilus assembly protein [Nitratireductor sp.]|nr:CpaD family pilus assembly protein [Nitratireductor sp.]MCC0021656.1 CpaD family pilus assembly protein [Nitratireductor sp.]
MFDRKLRTGQSGRPSSRRTGSGLILAVMASALLSGCASYSRDHVVVGSVPDDYRTRHPIVVSENQISQDIVIPAQAKSLSLRDRDVIRHAGLGFKRSGSGSIAIMVPAGSRNAASARSLAKQAAAELREINIPASAIRIVTYDAAGYGEAATLRVVYTDLTASVDSKCGDWGEDLTDTRDNRSYRNFGCATQNNLAQQIANPADLLGPRGETGIDPTRRTTVIQDYHDNGNGAI